MGGGAARKKPVPTFSLKPTILAFKAYIPELRLSEILTQSANSWKKMWHSLWDNVDLVLSHMRDDCNQDTCPLLYRTLPRDGNEDCVAEKLRPDLLVRIYA